MDGAKLITDTADHPKGCVLGRCSAWAEVLSGDNIDRAEMRIPVVVGSKQSEKLCHWKGKGSLAMIVSQGLVGPNPTHNMS